jgi:histidine ammonia-lyase
MTPAALVLDGRSLTRDTLAAYLDGHLGDPILTAGARLAMTRARAQVERWTTEGKVVYGVTTGLGRLKDWAVSPADQETFQWNILKSHAVGLGPDLPPEIGRLALLLRVNVWAQGHSGVRPELADRAAAFLALGLAPVVPQLGSLGVGDLQPMAHVGLALAGHPQGRIWAGGVPVPAPEVLARHGLERFPLAAKEALSLLAGGSVLLAGAFLAFRRARRVAWAAEAATALTLEALRAEAAALDPRIHAARGVPGQTAAAGRLARWVDGSGWMTAAGRARLGETSRRVQDAVSLRAAATVLGAVQEVLDFGDRALDGELNAATDNPLIFLPEAGASGEAEILSGGNFHGALLAYALDFLAVAAADLGALSERHSARLLDPAHSFGLPPALAGGEPGLNSGLTLVQAGAAALVAELRLAAVPASGGTLPAKSGQEDHNSLGPTALKKAVQALDHLETILAVELLCAHRAVALAAAAMTPLALGRGTAELAARLSSVIPPPGGDTDFKSQLDSVTTLLRTGEDLSPPSH